MSLSDVVEEVDEGTPPGADARVVLELSRRQYEGADRCPACGAPVRRAESCEACVACDWGQCR